MIIHRFLISLFVATTAAATSSLRGRRLTPAFSLSTEQCGATCSPAECTASEDATATFAASEAPDFAGELARMECSATCTASTSATALGGICSSKARMADMLRLDEGGIKAAYCTNEFLVVWTTGRPAWDADSYLEGIPLPPGADGGTRVRTAAEVLTVFKIPLAATPLAADASNAIANALPSVPGMPAAGAVAMAIDGVPMFPNYNNRGGFTWESCEVDRCNAHAGKGQDYHYHGDAFGDACLYSEDDYKGLSHPPLIGLGLDGYLSYGRYIAADQEGVEVALDACGGHEHGDLGYHYHSEVTTESTDTLDGTDLQGATVTYTAAKLGPAECWRGDVSAVANFWNDGETQALFDRSKGALADQPDYENLRPCCGMSEEHFFAAEGLTVNTVAEDEVTACASGSDDTGKNCPPDDSNGPCPAGCELEATSAPTSTPTAVPTVSPTASPTPAPTTSTPTASPTVAPTTASPTPSPTAAEVHCAAPVAVEGVDLSGCTSTVATSVCTAQCAEGFEGESVRMKCSKTGWWWWPDGAISCAATVTQPDWLGDFIAHQSSKVVGSTLVTAELGWRYYQSECDTCVTIEDFLSLVAEVCAEDEACLGFNFFGGAADPNVIFKTATGTTVANAKTYFYEKKSATV